MDKKKYIKKIVNQSVSLKRLYYWYRGLSYVDKYPDWGKILKKEEKVWKNALESSRSGPNILLATSMGGLPTATIMDSFLSVALTLRGANVFLLLCDSFLPSCLMCEVGLIKPKDLILHGPQKYSCKRCFSVGYEIVNKLDLPVLRYSDFVTTQEMRLSQTISSEVNYLDIKEYSLDDIKVGEHAVAGALRFFARGSLDGLTNAESVLRCYLKSAILTSYAIRRIIDNYNMECISGINGIYVPQGIVGEVARARKVRIAAWNVGYRKKTFIFSHGDTYHHTLISEPTEKWEKIDFSPQHDSFIMDYLVSRQRGGRDWITFLDKNPNEDLDSIAKQIGGLDFSKPCIGMLTNVVWDAQLHYPANAFPNMIDWVLRTIKYFCGRPELQLIVRIHPAEISGDIPSKQPIVEEIKNNFPVLTKNIFIIPPDSKISTYRVMEQCNAVIIFGTKTGVELSSRGIPVIVAGEAWIRDKGLTIDVNSVQHYFEALDQLPFVHGMTEEQIKKARKYAFHFFFRRMIPVSQMEETGGEPQFRINIKGLQDLQPGMGIGLDVICDGILKGTEFIYPAEKYIERTF